MVISTYGLFCYFPRLLGAGRGKLIFQYPVYSLSQHSGSSRNHRSLGRLFRFAHELTDKIFRTICSLCQSDVPADLSFLRLRRPA